jgi:hypothetical protein
MITQSIHDLSAELDNRAYFGSITARVLRRLSAPVFRKTLTFNKTVSATLWSHRVEIPANHHLPWILRHNPKWSQSLVHTVMALGRTRVRLIDVGANVGDTVIMLEQALPGVCESLCIEPDPRFVELCRKNIKGYQSDNRANICQR